MSKSSETPSSLDQLGPIPSQQGIVFEDAEMQNDAVFGEIHEGGPDYRNVGWLGTVALMMKTQLGLGILAIPSSFDKLGLIPGIICLCLVATLTGWASYIIGTFKQRHRTVYGLDDAARLMFGRIGYELFSAIFCIYWIFIAGSGMLGISIGLNAVSSHGTCTAVFVAAAAIAAFCLGSIRTLGRISWLAWVGLASILISILTVTIAVGIQDKPATAPKDKPWESDFKLFNNPSFTDAISAVSGFVYAYGGVPAFFSIAAEMRNPRHYTRSLIISQMAITVIYVAIGCVVYYFCGSYVASPALGSAGGTLKKVCYAIALPGLLVSTTLFVHIPGKYILVRVLRGSRHLTANTATHWTIWLGCTFGISISAYIVASAIPIFGSLTSLIGSLFGSLMSFQFMGFMWIYGHWATGKKKPTAKWIASVCWTIFVIVTGMFLMITGTYATVFNIIESNRASSGSTAWSCADNSNSS